MGLISFHFHTLDLRTYDRQLLYNNKSNFYPPYTALDCPIQNFTHKTPLIFNTKSQNSIFFQEIPFKIDYGNYLSEIPPKFIYNLRAPPLSS